MFNLETSITEWRRQMLAAGIKSPVPLDELETHLREEIGQQIKSGRTEAEAFETAIGNIGQAHKMQGEFKKIDPAKDVFKWKLIEISLGITVSVIPLFFCSAILRFKYSSFADFTPSQQISGVTALLVFAFLAWSGRLGCRMFPVIQSNRNRGIITAFFVVPLVLWWIIFMNVILPRHDFTMTQFLVAFFWAFLTPAGVVFGLLWGIETAARKSRTARVS
jgi:hypothetical protein